MFSDKRSDAPGLQVSDSVCDRDLHGMGITGIPLNSRGIENILRNSRGNVAVLNFYRASPPTGESNIQFFHMQIFWRMLNYNDNANWNIFFG